MNNLTDAPEKDASKINEQKNQTPAVSKKKVITERIILLSLAAVIVGLLVFFLKDVFFPFIELEIANDTEAAKELLLSKGVLGAVTVSVVEALQMVVIFIPAEFIQLSSGMSYPWWLAILLCDAGVVLGASIIYFIVHVFKFQGGGANKQNTIEKYHRKISSAGSTVFMYILFIMPIIPFGAICYWGSNRKMSYGRYILTVATGVIPSICSSIVMGAAIKEFLTRSLPLWLLIVIIIAAAAFLFILLAIVLRHFFFKKNVGTPLSIHYDISMKCMGLYIKSKNKIRVLPNDVKNIEGPYILLCNHHSAMDFYCVTRIDPDRSFAVVVNRYYYLFSKVAKFMQKGGFIPKKIFDADITTIKGMLKAKKEGFPIIMFPEGRLSTDGGPSDINLTTASFCKSLGIPIVTATVRKAYFSKPKWRKTRFRSDVEVKVTDVISAEQLKDMEKETLRARIKEDLCVNEFDYGDIKIKNKGKAEGLSNVLYYCPHCKSFYSNDSRGDDLFCRNCGATYRIKPDYTFEDVTFTENVNGTLPAEGIAAAKENALTSPKIRNLFEYYAKIKDMERGIMLQTDMDIPVTTRIFPAKNDKKNKPREDKGVFHFDAEKVCYKSTSSDIYFEYKVKELEGIAYSVNEEFEMYYNNELYYFYPEGDRKICTRVALIYELLKEED